MKQFSITMILIGLFSLNSLAQEADIELLSQEIEKTFGEQFPIRLKANRLAEAIVRVPAQSDSWNCGLVNAAHNQCLFPTKCDLVATDAEGDYPLSVKICTQNVVAMAKMVGVKTDAQNRILIGPSAHQLENFYNSAICTDEICAEAFSENELDIDQFLEKVKKSLQNQMPVIVYSAANDLSMHIQSIVGLADDKVLILDSNGIGVDRLKVVSIAQLAEKMNAEKSIKMVTVVNSARGFIEGMLQGNDKILSEDLVNKLNNYSFITFCNNEALQVEDVD